MSEFQKDRWRPTASNKVLRERAKLLAQIRSFFSGRNVMEVDTPLLAESTVTDPYMKPLCLASGVTEFFLQTSPEYSMKRLLSSGIGDIYQLGKVFRSEELGRKHQLEFTLLEWYRCGWDYHQLMDEVFELVSSITGITKRLKLTYDECFEHYLGIQLNRTDNQALYSKAQQLSGAIPKNLGRDELQALLFAFHIEPKFEPGKVVFVTDYPISQASLARPVPDNPQYAARFECFINGIELANGFWELTDAREQRKRFEADNQERVRLGLPERDIDEAFLSALEHGLPDCSGVALGVDRLLMIALGIDDISKVVPFALARR